MFDLRPSDYEEMDVITMRTACLLIVGLLSGVANDGTAAADGSATPAIRLIAPVPPGSRQISSRASWPTSSHIKWVGPSS